MNHCLKERCKFFRQAEFWASMFYCQLDDFQGKKKKDSECACIIDKIIIKEQLELESLKRYADKLDELRE